MAISGFTLGGFKAFDAPQSVRLPGLTLIYGGNSSGKSSLIHGLLWANNSYYTGSFDVHTLWSPSGAVDLGGFTEFVHGHRVDATATWGVSVSAARSAADRCPSENHIAGELVAVWESCQIETRIVIGLAGREPRPKSYHIFADGQPLLTLERYAPTRLCALPEPAGEDFKVSSIAEDHPLWEKLHHTTCRMVDRLLRQPQDCHEVDGLLEPSGYREVLRSAVFSTRNVDDVWGELQNHADATLGGLRLVESSYPRGGMPTRVLNSDEFHELALAMLEAFVDRCMVAVSGETVTAMQYLGPLRAMPNRWFDGHDEADFSDGGASWDNLAHDDDYLARVNRWLAYMTEPSTRFELQAGHLSYSFQPDRGASRETHSSKRLLQLVDTKRDVVLGPRDVGTGVTHLVPVIANLVGYQNSILLFEEPDLHLHPPMQADLADVLIDSVLIHHNLVVAETHSEHLLLRVLQRIREGVLDVNRLSVVFVASPSGPSNSTGSTVVELSISPDGQLLDRWPSGFFSERSR